MSIVMHWKPSTGKGNCARKSSLATRTSRFRLFLFTPVLSFIVCAAGLTEYWAGIIMWQRFNSYTITSQLQQIQQKLHVQTVLCALPASCSDWCCIHLYLKVMFLHQKLPLPLMKAVISITLGRQQQSHWCIRDNFPRLRHAHGTPKKG